MDNADAALSPLLHASLVSSPEAQDSSSTKSHFPLFIDNRLLDQESLAQRYQPTEGGRDPVISDVAYYARRVGLDVEKIKVKTEDGFLIDLWHVYDPSEYTSAAQEPTTTSSRLFTPFYSYIIFRRARGYTKLAPIEYRTANVGGPTSLSRTLGLQLERHSQHIGHTTDFEPSLLNLSNHDPVGQRLDEAVADGGASRPARPERKDRAHPGRRA
ncbi:hypothetical protein PWT90_10746 [Aphanocladium album]|nr:hypothetical protein PWT90_10746 [Aphanocladium album]